MYDINLKVIKKGNIIAHIFMGVGLLFLVIMLGVFISSKVKESKMDASVFSNRVEVNSYYDYEDDTEMYSPVYYYRVDGKEYECRSNSSSSIYPGDDNKLVYYNSKNPGECVSEYSKSSNKFLLLFTILPIIFIVIAVIFYRKTSKNVNMVKELNQKGKLVKGLPYRMEESNITVNNSVLLRPVVEYTLSSGEVVTLYGEPRYDRKTTDEDGLVDLVIDENNPSNYFIDFDINRINGNTPDDYYKQVNNS